jgi:hypothetical protein
MAGNPLEYLIPGKIRRKMQTSKLDDTIQGKVIEEKTGMKPSEYDSIADAYTALAAVQGIEKSSLAQTTAVAEGPSKIASATNVSTEEGIKKSLLENAVYGGPQEITNSIDQAGNKIPLNPNAQRAELGTGGKVDYKPSATSNVEAVIQKKAESGATAAGSKTGEMNVTREKFLQDFQTYEAFVGAVEFPTTGGLLGRLQNKARLMYKGAQGDTTEGNAYTQTLNLSRQLAPTIRRLSMDVGNATGWEQQGAIKLLIDGTETKMLKDFKMATLRDLTRAIQSGVPSAGKAILDSYIRSEQFIKTYGDYANDPMIQKRMNVEAFAQQKLAGGTDPRMVEAWRLKKLKELGIDNATKQ